MLYREAHGEIEFRLRLGVDIPSVDLDREAIQRALVNLLDNAVKYSDQGGKIRLTCADAGKAYEICVDNTGNPIPEPDQARIFDRFHRSDKGRAYESPLETGAGAGLGLAIGRSIARIHGGDLLLKSSKDTSTVFAAILPRPHSN